MRILVIVHHWIPDVNSTGLLMSRLFSSFSRRGHVVDVISTFPHYEAFRTWPQYRRKLWSKTTSENGGSITRVYSFTSGRKTMTARLLNYLSFNLLASV